MTDESIIIADADDGQRLDRWLKKNYPEIPFGQMQKILRTGQLRVDGKRAKGEARLSAGQILRIPPQLRLGPVKGKAGISEKDEAFIKSLVIYQDEGIIAINKPSGIATQGGSKVNKHIDGMLDALRFGYDERPHLVHRLDKDTSGVLLLARTTRMARALGDVFRGREIRKYYWALTSPAPIEDEGRIKSVIAKVEGRGGERMMGVSDGSGKMALTFYAVRERIGDNLAWVDFWPRTGRTHQIRVHASESGFPLLGDYKYGYEDGLVDLPEGKIGLHLHARRLIFEHPQTGRKIDIIAPLDQGMRKTFRFFGLSADDKSDPFADIE